jgi:hypothetical protein
MGKILEPCLTSLSSLSIPYVCREESLHPLTEVISSCPDLASLSLLFLQHSRECGYRWRLSDLSCAQHTLSSLTKLQLIFSNSKLIEGRILSCLTALCGLRCLSIGLVPLAYFFPSERDHPSGQLEASLSQLSMLETLNVFGMGDDALWLQQCCSKVVGLRTLSFAFPSCGVRHESADRNETDGTPYFRLDIDMFAKDLIHLVQLCELDLSDNRLTVAGVEELSMYTGHLTNMRVLRMQNSSLDSDHVDAVCMITSDPETSLIRLDLSGNMFSPSDFHKLACACENLSWLDLRSRENFRQGYSRNSSPQSILNEFRSIEGLEVVVGTVEDAFAYSER